MNPFTTFGEFVLAFLLSMMVWNATAWFEIDDGHFVLLCGDEDGDEIDCVSLAVTFDPWL